MGKLACCIHSLEMGAPPPKVKNSQQGSESERESQPLLELLAERPQDEFPAGLSLLGAKEPSWSILLCRGLVQNLADGRSLLKRCPSSLHPRPLFSGH